MAGLVPAIHGFLDFKEDVDGRHKAGHDEVSNLSNCFDGSFAAAQDTCNGTGFADLMGCCGEPGLRQPAAPVAAFCDG
jgi:hypothetical protein